MIRIIKIYFYLIFCSFFVEFSRNIMRSILVLRMPQPHHHLLKLWKFDAIHWFDLESTMDPLILIQILPHRCIWKMIIGVSESDLIGVVLRRGLIFSNFKMTKSSRCVSTMIFRDVGKYMDWIYNLDKFWL